MKISYLIQAHSNPKHLNNLIKALDSKNIDFYVHIDKKTKTKFSIPKKKNIFLLKERVPVYWGGFSQVQASIMLLKQAIKKKYDYYVLLSGVDFPIKSKSYIERFLTQYNGNQFIDFYPMPMFDKSFDRMDYFRIEGHENKYLNYFFTKVNKVILLLRIKRKFPIEYSNFKFFAGASWWAFTHDCAEHILQFIERNPKFVKFYKNTLCPDEMFFQTIIGNSKFSKRIMNSFTYADWNADPKPAIINKRHLAIMNKDYIETRFGNKKKYLLFARKFNDKSANIIKDITKNFN